MRPEGTSMAIQDDIMSLPGERMPGRGKRMAVSFAKLRNRHFKMQY